MIKQALIRAVAGRYARASRVERSQFLDKFSAVTGLHHKHAVRLLRVGQACKVSAPCLGRRLYDDATREALVVIWGASDRVCDRWLQPLVPILVEPIKRHGHLQLAPQRPRWDALACRDARKAEPMQQLAFAALCKVTSNTRAIRAVMSM